MKRLGKRLLAFLLAGLLMLSPALAAESGALEDWALLLANPWTPLPENFTVEVASLKNGLQVDRRIYDALSAMLQDCQAAGLHPLVCSAYRSYATQQRLYRNKIARLRAAGWSEAAAPAEAARWVAVPGTSEHQTGLALDLVSLGYQVLDRKQETTPEQQWLMAHSWEYGFILRYPEDKQEMTGIGYEPWHYRYVGKTAAAAMHQSGQCLEEYLTPPPADPKETALRTGNLILGKTIESLLDKWEII